MSPGQRKSTGFSVAVSGAVVASIVSDRIHALVSIAVRECKMHAPVRSGGQVVQRTSGREVVGVGRGGGRLKA